MYIESMKLSNFRNYETLEINFDRGTNILYGDNAQGKTNILEAVYLSSTSKSHRGSRDREIIRFGCEEAHIRTAVKKSDLSYKIDMHLRKNKSKGVAINGIPIRKARELLGVVNVVFFSPEDLNIIKNGPGERRRFIDYELCQLDSIYISDLAAYNHLLNQRNVLLKDFYLKSDSKNILEILDEQIADYGSRIIKKRRDFLKELYLLAERIHENLTGGMEKISLLYEPNTEEKYLLKTFEKNREKDIRLKITSAGPQRDDFCVKINGIDIRRYGSQGQQRTAALSLKLSEIYLVRKKTGEAPVLLLDDVLSELDSSRQNYLLENIKDTQTIITCTGLDDFISHQFKINKVFHVQRGQICECQN